MFVFLLQLTSQLTSHIMNNNASDLQYIQPQLQAAAPFVQYQPAAAPAIQQLTARNQQASQLFAAARQSAAGEAAAAAQFAAAATQPLCMSHIILAPPAHNQAQALSAQTGTLLRSCRHDVRGDVTLRHLSANERFVFCNVATLLRSLLRVSLFLT